MNHPGKTGRPKLAPRRRPGQTAQPLPRPKPGVAVGLPEALNGVRWFAVTAARFKPIEATPTNYRWDMSLAVRLRTELKNLLVLVGCKHCATSFSVRGCIISFLMWERIASQRNGYRRGKLEGAEGRIEYSTPQVRGLPSGNRR